MLDIGYLVHSGVNADLLLYAETTAQSALFAFFSLHVLYALRLLDPLHLVKIVHIIFKFLG